MLPPGASALIDLALVEDLALGDLTAEAIFSPDHRSSATVLAKQDLVVCGLAIAADVFRRVDAGSTFRPLCTDGTAVAPRTAIATVTGPTIGLLSAERTALNFLQRLSGIATLCRRYADVARDRVRVVDTRKTTPGWRALEKYAVRTGGCHNHRSTLGEHVLIKDNHLAAAGSIRTAVARARDRAAHTARIEVEVTTLEQLDDALAAGADVVLLDNFTPDLVAQAVSRTAGRARLEASGGINLGTLEAFAVTGVDVVSVGALTHSATAVDISLEFDAAPPPPA